MAYRRTLKSLPIPWMIRQGQAFLNFKHLLLAIDKNNLQEVKTTLSGNVDPTINHNIALRMDKFSVKHVCTMSGQLRFFVDFKQEVYQYSYKDGELIDVSINHRFQVEKALQTPIRQIAINAGQEGSLVVQEVLSKKTPIGYGYNAQTDQYEDLVKAGVIDPTKVARTALQNASSIAGLMLTTEALVTEIKEEEKAMPAPGGGMGGPGMY